MKKVCSEKFKGVRFRLHPTRKHGVQPDRYFFLRFQIGGKRVEEGLGWASEGWTEAKAGLELERLKTAAKTGEGPCRLQEKRSIADAKRRADQAEAERQARQGVSFQSFWETDYFLALKNRVKESSWQKEAAHFRLWLSPTLGPLPLREITDVDLERVQDRIRSAGLSDRSHEYIMGTFRRVWKHAMKRHIVSAECPVKKLDIPRPNNTRLRVLTPDEARQLLDLLRDLDPTTHDLTLFAMLTGCRASEAFGLKWGHVDLARGSAIFPETKNREAREVFLADELVNMLRRRGPGSVGAHVFPMADGKPYSEAPSYFRTAVDRLELNKDRGARERLTFHSLRHSAATYAVRRGTPIKDAQIVFGWKTPAMVFRYAKGSEDVQRRAMQGLEQAYKAEPGKVLDFPGRKAAGDVAEE
jgi:integrase